MNKKVYYQNNREIILIRGKEYYEKNKEILRERAKNKYKELPEKKKINTKSMLKTDITCLKKKNKN